MNNCTKDSRSVWEVYDMLPEEEFLREDHENDASSGRDRTFSKH